MLHSLFDNLAGFFRAKGRKLPRHRQSSPPASRQFRPRLEALENRTLLATFHWVGNGFDGKWTTAANWIRVGAGGNHPGANDTAVFDTLAAGAESNTMMDLPGALPKIAKLKIEAGFTGDIYLEKSLTVTKHFVQRNGNIYLAGKNLYLEDLDATSAWVGGSIVSGGGAHFNTVYVKGGKLNIAAEGGRTPTLNGALNGVKMGLTSRAEVTWSAGNFDLVNNVRLWVGRETKFIITSSGTMGTTRGAWLCSNDGTVIKKGAGTATMKNVNVKGKGTFDIQAGKLNRIKPAPAGGRAAAPGDASQVVYLQEPGATLTIAAGATLEDVGDEQLYGLTTLAAGSTQKVSDGIAHLYSGGTLRGQGTLDGDFLNEGLVFISNYEDFQGNRVLPGVLMVTGEYTQTQTGMLQMYVSAAGSDLLAVGGRASLGGSLEVDTFYGYMPPDDATIMLVTAGSLAGEFSSVALNGLPGEWQVNYNPTSVTLTKLHIIQTLNPLDFLELADPLKTGLVLDTLFQGDRIIQSR